MKKVAEYETDNLNLVGIDMIGKKNHINKLTKEIKLYD
ncbi:DUF2000 family protein [Gottschalkia purinilytica]|nr:DUF2000 family protein [Gottschalkia purinilytica]